MHAAVFLKGRAPRSRREAAELMQDENSRVNPNGRNETFNPYRLVKERSLKNGGFAGLLFEVYKDVAVLNGNG